MNERANITNTEKSSRLRRASKTLATFSGAALFLASCSNEANEPPVDQPSATASKKTKETPSKNPSSPTSPTVLQCETPSASNELFEFSKLSKICALQQFHGTVLIRWLDTNIENSPYVGLGVMNPAISKDDEGNLQIGIQKIADDGITASTDTLRWIKADHKQIDSIQFLTQEDSSGIITNEKFHTSITVQVADNQRSGNLLQTKNYEKKITSLLNFSLDEQSKLDKAGIIGAPLNFYEADPSLHETQVQVLQNDFGYKNSNPEDLQKLVAPSKKRNNLPCTPLLFIGARGSGDEYGEDGMGDTLILLSNSLRSYYKNRVTIHGLPYEAITVNEPLNNVGNSEYHESVKLGKYLLKNTLQQQVENCPNQKLILAGYSQGAEVVGDSITEVDKNIRQKIAAVTLFGDPNFNPASPVAKGDFQKELYGFFGKRPSFPSDLNDKIQSYCRRGDGVCNANTKNLLRLTLQSSPHNHYESWIENAHNFITIKTQEA